MNFFGTLVAVLLALYVTGNVQDGSPFALMISEAGMSDILHFVTVFSVILVSVLAFLLVKRYGASPRKLWAKFKNGELF